MKVYLAAPYLVRDQLRACADELELIGMTVTSRWLTEDTPIDAGTVGAATSVEDLSVSVHCTHDFADIDKAHALVVFTGDAAVELLDDGAIYDQNMLHSGGRHIETGYAIAKNKRIVIIGEPENVFHRGVGTVVPDWHRAVLELCALDRRRNYPVAAEAAS